MKSLLQKSKQWLNEEIDFGIKSEFLRIKKIGLRAWLNEPIQSHQHQADLNRNDNLNSQSAIIENTLKSDYQDQTDLSNLNNIMIEDKMNYQDKMYYLNLYISIPFTPSIATPCTPSIATPYTPVHEPETPPIDITKGAFTSCESFITEEETTRINIDTTLINDDLSHK